MIGEFQFEESASAAAVTKEPRNSPSRNEATVAFNALESSNWDLLAALGWPFHSDPLEALRNSLRQLTGRQHVFLTPSGRSAIVQVLLSLPQREVVMPAWICNDVRRAAELAGKRVIYVDLAKNNINATAAEYAEAAKPGRILLAAHLFGVPTDIEAICELARSRDCVTIEDAVPAFGARSNGRLLGTIADFGVYGFEEGKRFPAFHGGAIVMNNEQIVNPAKLAACKPLPTERPMPVGGIARALLHNFVTRPWIYKTLTQSLLPLRDSGQSMAKRLRSRFVTSPPSSRARVSMSSTEIPRTAAYTRELHPYQAQLLLRMFGRLDEIREHIASLTKTYLNAFQNTLVDALLPHDCDHAGLMRFPIVCAGKDRARIMESARKRGLCLKVYWPRPLPDEAECGKFPNAVWTGNNLLLLPLYRRLSQKSAETIAQVVLESVRESRS